MPISETDAAFITPTIPPVKLTLADIPSIEEPVIESMRFLSSLDQEIEWAFQPKDLDVVKTESSENTAVPNLKLKSICAMSAYQVSSNIGDRSHLVSFRRFWNCRLVQTMSVLNVLCLWLDRLELLKNSQVHRTKPTKIILYFYVLW